MIFDKTAYPTSTMHQLNDNIKELSYAIAAKHKSSNFYEPQLQNYCLDVKDLEFLEFDDTSIS